MKENSFSDSGSDNDMITEIVARPCWRYCQKALIRRISFADFVHGCTFSWENVLRPSGFRQKPCTTEKPEKPFTSKLGKLDQVIQKDAAKTVPSPLSPGTGNGSNAAVPSIVVHNGSPTVLSSSAEVPPSNQGSQKQTVAEEEDKKRHNMSLGDEPVASQHGPNMNSVTTSQRPANCLPVLPAVSPTVNKQNMLNTALTGGNRNLTKANSVPVRSKPERCLSKEESFEADGGATPPHQRIRNNPKVKLLQRSHALREETSPPRESEVSHTSPNNSSDKSSTNKAVNGVNNSNNNNNQVTSNNSSNTNNNGRGGSGGMGHGSNPSYSSGSSLHVNNNIGQSNSRHKLRHQGSSQGSMDNSSPCLSRDSSTEQYMENLGFDLNQFLIDTLNRSLKDRMFLLQIEQELIALVREAKRGAFQRFPGMTSYQRMLIHRVATYFKMDHNVDATGSGVVVTVTPNSRIPEVKFNELLREDLRFPEEPRRCILKRDSSSFEEGMQLRSPERQLSGDSRRSKSFEEREEEYERARKRIFNRDDGFPTGSPYRSHDPNSRRSSHEDLRWHGDPQFWSSSDSDICSSRGRYFPTSRYGRFTRISKVESFEGNDTLKANSLKSSVSKSYSFGGYPGISRGDSISSNSSSRALNKEADSVTSSVSSTRLSPSSSGYKSQSVRSDVTASTTPSPSQATSQCSFSPEPNTVVWAVSSLTAVPAGAVLINPASGQPYTNPDGSLYRYDPDNPIKLCPTIEEDVSANTVYTPSSSKVVTGNDTPDYVIKEKDTKVETSVQSTDLESSGNEVTAKKSTTVLINSSTSPSLPELPRNNIIPATDTKPPQSDSGRIDTVKEPDRPASYQSEAILNNPNSGQMNSAVLETMSVEVAQTNYNDIESENSVYMDNIGSNSLVSATNCQGDVTDYSGQMPYQMAYSSTANIQNAPEYGSQSANNGAYMNSNVGVTSINYGMGPPYSAETMHMPPEMLYSQSVVYAAGQQSNPYGVVHTPTAAAAPTSGVPPPPPPLPSLPTAGTGTGTGPSNIPVPTTASTYESRPNEANPSMAVPELSNYFMGLNIGNEQITSSATPAPQLGYSWGPSPNTSQTQGSSHSSQIQMYYLPGSVSTGGMQQKYTSTGPSMYAYNVPPVVYQSDLCQSMIQNTATAVFPASYYSPAPATTMSYRTQTPPTPSAVTAATPMGPTSFFVYHPQSSAPTQPPPLQFGMVRPQQPVPGIRSSPPPGPRPRVPYNRSMSERSRHSSMEAKTSNLHFSSPLSMYGLRFMPGDFQSIGMMRPMSNIRTSSGGFNSSSSHLGSSGSVNDSGLLSSRPPRPRKPR